MRISLEGSRITAGISTINSIPSRDPDIDRHANRNGRRSISQKCIAVNAGITRRTTLNTRGGHRHSGKDISRQGCQRCIHIKPDLEICACRIIITRRPICWGNANSSSRRNTAGVSNPPTPIIGTVCRSIVNRVPRLFDRWAGAEPVRVWGHNGYKIPTSPCKLAVTPIERTLCVHFRPLQPKFRSPRVFFS